MEMDEDEFVGKVSISNWAMTRKQRILRSIDFESKTFDIYNPEFSSDEEETERKSKRKSQRLIATQKDFFTKKLNAILEKERELMDGKRDRDRYLEDESLDQLMASHPRPATRQ